MTTISVSLSVVDTLAAKPYSPRIQILFVGYDSIACLINVKSPKI
mgnify:FL=1